MYPSHVPENTAKTIKTIRATPPKTIAITRNRRNNNKEGHPIHVAVKSDGELVAKNGATIFTIESMKVLPLEGVDVMNKKTEFLIWKDAPADANQAPTWRYTVEPGKTIYVTFKDAKLRPQTGPGKGILGKTDTLLSLKKNVGSADVVKA